MLPPRTSGFRQMSVGQPGVSWMLRIPWQLLEICSGWLRELRRRQAPLSGQSNSCPGSASIGSQLPGKHSGVNTPVSCTLSQVMLLSAQPFPICFTPHISLSSPCCVGGSLSIVFSRWGNRTWKSKSISKSPCWLAWNNLERCRLLEQCAPGELWSMCFLWPQLNIVIFPKYYTLSLLHLLVTAPLFSYPFVILRCQ